MNIFTFNIGPLQFNTQNIRSDIDLPRISCVDITCKSGQKCFDDIGCIDICSTMDGSTCNNPNQDCIIDNDSCVFRDEGPDCMGYCIESCGGMIGLKCSDDSAHCVESPIDDCNPIHAGICVSLASLELESTEAPVSTEGTHYIDHFFVLPSIHRDMGCNLHRIARMYFVQYVYQYHAPQLRPVFHIHK